MTAAILGFVMGFFGSVPITGPVAMMVLLWAAKGRTRAAMALVLGAALVESGYAGLAFYGFAALLTEYAWVQPLSELVAALVLIGLGILFIRYQPSDQSEESREAPAELARATLLGMTLVGLNPTMLATWGGAVTIVFSFQLAEFTSADSLSFGAGAGMGIVAWFTLVILGVGRLRNRLSEQRLGRTVHLAGAMIALLGVGLLLRFVFGY